MAKPFNFLNASCSYHFTHFNLLEYEMNNTFFIFGYSKNMQ